MGVSLVYLGRNDEDREMDGMYRAIQKVGSAQQKKFAELFKNAHCTNKGLPDFFGFKIKKNFLTRWTPT